MFLVSYIHSNSVPTTALDAPPPPSDTGSTGHLYLIAGTFEDINRHAGRTADWIAKVAHLICDLRGAGQVYTHATGTWIESYALPKVSNWRHPGTYEFESLSHHHTFENQ